LPQGSLAGLKVVDCSHVMAGAYCSMMLADLGADVIKVEPIGGEAGRGGRRTRFSGLDWVNRNKRAIAVDLRKPEGVELIRRLVGEADIFVENFRPGVFDRLGLGYEDLRELNPRLIYCSISGFGHTGPYRERGGFDLIAQAVSGVMSYTGETGATRPVASGAPLADAGTACFGALAILAALQARHTTGVGQKVEATLVESSLSHAIWEAGLYLTTGEIAIPRGTRHRLAAPYEALKTADGFIVVGVNSEDLWERLCDAVGLPELKADARFNTLKGRLANRDALEAALEAVLTQQPTDHWIERFGDEGVPCGPVNDIGQAVEDPHIQARGLFQDVDGVRYLRTPVTMSETPVSIRGGAPAVGQHTREVLKEAGLPESQIAALEADGVIQVAAG